MPQQYYSFCLQRKSNPMTDLRIRWHLKKLHTLRENSERLNITGIGTIPLTALTLSGKNVSCKLKCL